MKSFEIEPWFNVNRSTPGRRAYTARRTKEAALALDYSAIAAACDAMVAQEQAQLERLRRYNADRALATAASWSPEINADDVLLDRLVVELRDTLGVLGQRTSSPRGQAAQTLLERYFAQGVPYYTQQVFEEEAERVRELVAGLTRDRALVEGATVTEVVDELGEVHTRYADAIAAFRKSDRTDFALVKQGELDNQRALLELIAQVLATTAELPVEKRLAQRQALLTTAAEQDQDISDLVRSRRKVRDVNPETGVPVPDASADTAAPADGTAVG